MNAKRGITMTNLPSWLTGTLNKHEREAMEVLRDLLDAAWGKGWCTAEDIKHPPMEPNLIGCCFKRLRACGLYQTEERVKPTQKQKHGRPLYKWAVRSSARLEQVRSAITAMNRRTLTREEPAQESNQYLLAV